MVADFQNHKPITRFHGSAAARRGANSKVVRAFFCIFRSRKYAVIDFRFALFQIPDRTRHDRLSIGKNNVAKVARLRHFSTGTNRRERAFNKASRVAITKADSNGPPVFFFRFFLRF
jgi:hypothetical protein